LKVFTIIQPLAEPSIREPGEPVCCKVGLQHTTPLASSV